MQNGRAFLQRHAVATYFSLVLLISWGSFLVLVGPKLLRSGGEQATDAFVLFPIIVVGVCLVGIALTGIVDGRPGLRDLFARVGRWRVGAYWVPFFLTFVAIVTAVRVLIVWIYSNTGSVLLAQLMHASLTVSLATFDPVGVSPAQETLWYMVYAVVLWVVVAVVAVTYGKSLVRRAEPAKEMRAENR